MQLFKKLDEVISEGEEVFQNFIKAEKEKDPKFLQYDFCPKEGEPLTILNYLIQQHNKQLADKTPHINWLLDNGANIDGSLRFLLKENKKDLLPLFIDACAQRMKQGWKYNGDHDIAGQTLLARVIATKDLSILKTFLSDEWDLNLNQSSQLPVTGQLLKLQPLHQAIVKDFPEAIPELLKKGAKIDNSCGHLGQTPLLLAASYGKIKALEKLLQWNEPCLDLNVLNAKNTESKSSIDLLCERLKEDQDSQGAIQGIALLLCHGVDAPSNEVFQDLLMDNRIALLDAVKKYRDEGYSIVHFVRACHDKNNPLHDIIYANKSWLQWLWRLLGLPCREAFLIEELVYAGLDAKNDNNNSEKILSSTSDNGGIDEIPSSSFQGINKQLQENLVTEETKQPIIAIERVGKNTNDNFNDQEEQFAEFVKRYKYKCPLFGSKVYTRLITGEYTFIDQIRRYADQNNEDILTRDILRDIDGETTSMHLNLYPSCSMQ